LDLGDLGLGDLGLGDLGLGDLDLGDLDLGLANFVFSFLINFLISWHIFVLDSFDIPFALGKQSL
jgi:hypothetical protein